MTRESEARKRLIERFEDATLPDDVQLLIDAYRNAVLLEATDRLDGGTTTAADAVDVSRTAYHLTDTPQFRRAVEAMDYDPVETELDHAEMLRLALAVLTDDTCPTCKVWAEAYEGAAQQCPDCTNGKVKPLRAGER